MEETQVAIIGGGATGFSTAYQLSKLGITDVKVLDRMSLVRGATGRNAGGVRAQWSSADNIELARRSMAMFQKFAQETGHNIFYRKSGYLFLTRKEDQFERMKAAATYQNQHGVRTKVIDAQACQEIVPELNIDGVIGANWNPDDAILFPWPLVWGWKEAAEKAGVTTSTYTRVDAMREKGDQIQLTTNRGELLADHVVNASGAWSHEVAAMLGVDLPNRPERHEILVTEPLKPFLQPMLVDLSTGLYLNQDMRGEVLGGLGTHHIHSMDWGSSLGFLTEFARQTTSLLPILNRVKVLRQWAGSYDVTPDAVPNLGPAHTGPATFHQANGFSGHGMMISPMVGRILAQSIAGQKPDVPLEPYSTKRFEDPALKREGMVIG